MEQSVAKHQGDDAIIQFSVFADNKVGRLNDLIQRLNQADVHIMAISQIDSTECTIIRLIVNYPEVCDEVLTKFGYSFTETEVVGVEIRSEADLKFITSALIEAEINIHYLYAFVCRPRETSALVLHVEDNELAESVISSRNYKVLYQSDIAR